jgi:AraC-like DNA-binding protein
MDGFELCKSIKNFTNTCHIYVILMTSNGSQANEMTSFGNGADFYLPKPFTEESLLLLLGNIMKLRANLRIKFSKYSMPLSQLDLVPEKETFIHKATQVIENNISNENFHVEEFCLEMGMSRAHLHRKFRSLTNQTTTEFIRSVRLQKAVQLLKSEQFTVDQISTQVGFSSSTYFSTCFKQYYQVSPGKYLLHFDQEVL